MARDEINAFLGSGTNFNGVLSFQGSVRVDGSFIGEIQSDGVLVAGKEAKLQGKFSVGEFTLAGTFEGDLIASRRITIFKGGIIKGSIKTPSLIVEDGAIVDGHINMITKPEDKAQELKIN